MFTLSSCDDCWYSRSDDQFATAVAKMPVDGLFGSDISTPRRYVLNVTHELHPGEMHWEMEGLAQFLRLVSSRLTDRKLHPEIFSHGVLQAGVDVISYAQLGPRKCT